jgi:hypothetical protein
MQYYNGLFMWWMSKVVTPREVCFPYFFSLKENNLYWGLINWFSPHTMAITVLLYRTIHWERLFNTIYNRWIFFFKFTEKLNNCWLRITHLFPHGIIRPVISVSSLAWITSLKICFVNMSVIYAFAQLFLSMLPSTFIPGDRFVYRTGLSSWNEYNKK